MPGLGLNTYNYWLFFLGANQICFISNLWYWYSNRTILITKFEFQNFSGKMELQILTYFDK